MAVDRVALEDHAEATPGIPVAEDLVAEAVVVAEPAANRKKVPAAVLAMIRPAMIRPAMIRPAMIRPAMIRPAMIRPAMIRREEALDGANLIELIPAGKREEPNRTSPGTNRVATRVSPIKVAKETADVLDAGNR